MGRRHVNSTTFGQLSFTFKQTYPGRIGVAFQAMFARKMLKLVIEKRKNIARGKDTAGFDTFTR